MARWRQPAIIWLRRVKKNQYWNRQRGVRAPAPRGIRIPWTSASLYGLTLIAAGVVLWKVPARPSSTLPVTTGVAASQKPSWMDRTVSGMRAPESTLRAWLNDGMPIIGLTLNPRNFAIHVRGLVLTGLSEISGVRLQSLSGLLDMEIPQLAVVKSPALKAAKPPARIARASPRPKAQEAVDKSLPGDGGRVWAELGTEPLVGIYQTHSHESFWPYVSSGSTTPYSTDWSKTIVQVGWWLAQDLHQTGMAVVQSRVDNMSEGVLASYNKSYYTAKDLLEWYPSVRMLIDLHRSATDMKPATVRGEKVSKILLVVGTNKLLPNEYWHQNLEVALRLAQALNQLAPGILEGKGVEMVPYRYNQQLMPADLMVEVGGPSSTLSEERYAVHDLALAIDQVFHDGGVPQKR